MLCRTERHAAQHIDHLFRRHRLTDEIALTEIASERPHPVDVILRLDAFRHDGEAQIMRQQDDRFQDERGLGIARIDFDETAINLQRVERQAAEIG